jgi:ubiquinone/menaquinone biosynthesis C-methylase UbiE
MSPDLTRGDQATRDWWDEHSKTYDEAYETFSGAVTNYVDWELLKGYLPTSKNARILEAAGGTGRITLPLAKSGYSVTLCDISAGMLSMAEEKLLQEGVLSRVEISQCDARNLPFADGSFDLCLCWFGMVVAAREVIRVTKKGGIVSIFLQNRCKEAIKLFSRDPESALALLKTPSDLLSADGEKYYHKTIRVEEAYELFSAEGVRVLDIFGVRGLTGVLPIPQEARESKHWNGGYFSQVAQMALQMSQEPSIKGMFDVMVLYGERV